MFQNQKTVLVTGAGKGIGRSTALRLARDGMQVGVVATSQESAQNVADEITAEGGAALPIAADVSRPEAVEQMFKTFLDAYGHLDCIAANAGIYMADTFLDMPYERFDRIQSVNLDGVLLCVQKAADIMIRQGKGGHIGVTLSQGGFGESDHTFSYIVSKWAGRGLVRSIAKKYAKYGIKVNAIAPGNIPTPMFDSIVDTFAGQAGAPKDAILSNMTTSVPLGRLQPPEEMAALYSYLFSDAAKNMVGFTIIDNGAMMLGS